ncbi:MAG: hypothetical protein V9E90_16785 [Saprospiraceae bacterium]|jgi:hypothetical protein
MLGLPDFPLILNGICSNAFKKLQIFQFKDACKFVSLLPYRRNVDKTDPLAVLVEAHGTCSTKHALLKRLADEQNQTKITLQLGIFEMNENNTPILSNVLKANRLSAVPEAHCYLKYKMLRFDFTGNAAIKLDIENEILEEYEINPDEIYNRKLVIHKMFIKQWLLSNNMNHLNDQQIWEIREKCIKQISDT